MAVYTLFNPLEHQSIKLHYLCLQLFFIFVSTKKNSRIHKLENTLEIAPLLQKIRNIFPTCIPNNLLSSCFFCAINIDYFRIFLIFQLVHFSFIAMYTIYAHRNVSRQKKNETNKIKINSNKNKIRKKKHISCILSLTITLICIKDYIVIYFMKIFVMQFVSFVLLCGCSIIPFSFSISHSHSISSFLTNFALLSYNQARPRRQPTRKNKKKKKMVVTL